MLVGMAIGAFEPGMGTWVLVQSGGLLLMTLSAEISQIITVGNQDRAVGVGMAGGAVGKGLSMRQHVTIAALGHHLSPIVFARIVSVDDFMAPLAIKLVPAAGISQVLVLRGVALTALGGSQGGRSRRKPGGFCC